MIVFDLRNGRVGGLSFCQAVESWFHPEQSFMIPNETSSAVSQWESFTERRRNNVDFIWGHNFTKFNNIVKLSRKINFIQLVRHPLLKISGVKLLKENDLHLLYTRSFQLEFEEYKNNPGLLSAKNLDEFHSAHYMMGVTELMEESLFLLHSRLKVQASIRPWVRSGVEANLDKNIFSTGLTGAFVDQQYYAEELEIYRMTCDRLLSECREAGFLKTKKFSSYKKSTLTTDEITMKWRACFPGLFHFDETKLTRGERKALPQLGKRQGLFWRAVKSSPRSRTKIGSRPGHWTVYVGAYPAERTIEGASGNGRAFQIGDRGLVFDIKHGEVAGAPNILHLEIYFPFLMQGVRTVRCAISSALFFETDVGLEAGVRAFDVPVSPETRRIKLEIVVDSNSALDKATARLSRVAVLRVPI